MLFESFFFRHHVIHRLERTCTNDKCYIIYIYGPILGPTLLSINDESSQLFFCLFQINAGFTIKAKLCYDCRKLTRILSSLSVNNLCTSSFYFNHKNISFLYHFGLLRHLHFYFFLLLHLSVD